MTFTEFVKKASLEADDPTMELVRPRSPSLGHQSQQIVSAQTLEPQSRQGTQLSQTELSLLESDDDPTVAMGPRPGAIALDANHPQALQQPHPGVPPLHDPAGGLLAGTPRKDALPESEDDPTIALGPRLSATAVSETHQAASQSLSASHTSITDIAGGPKISPSPSLFLPERDDDPTILIDRYVDEPTIPAIYQPDFQVLTADGARPGANPVLYREPGKAEDALIVFAQPLLSLLAELKTQVQPTDVPALRRFIVDEIKRFESRALEFGVLASDVDDARYVLCAVFDEAILTSPWGGHTEWSAHSLLGEFFGDAWGGEKVFAILERVRRDEGERLSLIKLIDTCLLLGYEGQYRFVDGGSQQLDVLCADLGRRIESQQKPSQRELSPTSKPVVAQVASWRAMPLWAVFAGVAAILLVVFGGFNFMLSLDVLPILSDIDALNSRLLER